MTQAGGTGRPGTPGRRMTASSGGDIYTVLAAVAVVALLVAVVYVGVKNAKMTGGSNPFAVIPSAGWIHSLE
ncbi:MAG: hypothetical protein IT443_03785 [Phycisphaeraceae bacterium]|nr:hypothetical protein [Phycisphaeraceae bacterium]